MKKIFVLGATGSIGSQTLDIILNNPNKYQLIGFSFNQNLHQALSIIKKFSPKIVIASNIDNYKVLKNANIANCIIYHDSVQAINSCSNDVIFVNAISGYNGLAYSHIILQNAHNLLLANKESLVAAGPLLKDLAEKQNVQIIPIDSEHTALHDLLNTLKDKNLPIKKYYITASGGALRDYQLDELVNVKKEDVLKHPTWSMGAKITVDSATMMNKVFEVCEACYLFNINYNDIDILIDRTSHIHAMLETQDGKVLPHVCSNDMHLPISYALSFPDFVTYNEIKDQLDKKTLINKYHLSPIDTKRYKTINLIKEILINHPFSGIIIVTINDLLVKKFLNDEISFLSIENYLFKIYDELKNQFNDLEYNFNNLLKVKEFIERNFEELCK